MHRLAHTTTRAAAFLVMVIIGLGSGRADGAGGTSQVATAGQPVHEQSHWPEGTREFLELPERKDGWNGWFSEWPSDVCHYELHASDSEQLNKVIAAFGRIESDNLQIRLSPMSEPRGLDWVLSLPEGNGTPAMFSIGNQQQINDWYQRLPGGKFGVMQFEETPAAVPPTLTIFVGNDVVDLADLQIPDHIVVSAGYVPTIFWEWHRTNRPQRPAAAESEPTPPEIQAAADAISTFLKQRQAAIDAKAGSDDE